MAIDLAPEFRGRTRSASRRISRRAAFVGACALAFAAPARAQTSVSQESAALDTSARKLLPAKHGHLKTVVLPDLSGRTKRLDDFRGRTLLLHFFATWCEPCRAEFASLQELLVREAHVSVLAVSVAEVPIRVRRFFGDTPPPFTVLLDERRTASKDWDVTALPTTFVLGRDLHPRFYVEGDIDWQRPDVVADLRAVSAEQ